MEKPKKSKTLFIAVLAAVLLAAAGAGWYFGYKVPHDKARAKAYADYTAAVEAYNEAVRNYNDNAQAYNAVLSKIAAENAKLHAAVDAAQAALDAGEIPYDASAETTLRDAVETTLHALQELPGKIDARTGTAISEETGKSSIDALESMTADTDSATDELETASNAIAHDAALLRVPDYGPVLAALGLAGEAFHDSVAVYKQVTNPSEAFIIARITGLENIGQIAPVTEEHDPNGQLNKPGGYTATVYFSSPLVADAYHHSGDVIEDGTDGGGAIEVFENVADATERRDYLALFDGGIFASGSHTVVGTCVIRISNELTASQQKALEASIVEAITKLEK